MSVNGLMDIFTSRRVEFDDCVFWKRDEEISNFLEYDMLESCATFSASQITSIEQMPQVVAGIFMFDSSTVTIKSYDDLSEMDFNDVVKFRGKFYRVESVQGVPTRKTNQFTDAVGYTYYMRLKR